MNKSHNNEYFLAYNNNAKNMTARNIEQFKAVRNATKNMVATSQIIAEKANHGLQEIKEKRDAARKTYKNLKNFFN